MIAQLRERVTEVGPLGRSDGNPLDAAAVGYQQDGRRNQPKTNPYGPPVLLSEELRAGAGFAGQGLASVFYELCHGRSLSTVIGPSLPLRVGRFAAIASRGSGGAAAPARAGCSLSAHPRRRLWPPSWWAGCLSPACHLVARRSAPRLLQRRRHPWPPTG